MMAMHCGLTRNFISGAEVGQHLVAGHDRARSELRGRHRKHEFNPDPLSWFISAFQASQQWATVRSPLSMIA
jgi:hypothetical protein